MKRYELTAIISEKSDEKETEAITKTIKKFIVEDGGKIESENTIGRKKLVYPIKKNEFGTYLVFKFSSEKDQIKNLQAQIKAESEIIRYMLIGLPAMIAEETKKPRIQRIEAKGVPLGEKAEVKKVEKVGEIEEVKKTVVKEADLKKVEKAEKIEKIDEKESKPAKKITKEKPKEKPAIVKEIESEGDRMKKLEEELDKILEE